MKIFNIKSISAFTPKEWTCEKCLAIILPFHNATMTSLEDSLDISDTNISSSQQDPHLTMLMEREAQLKIMHINTQSMMSSFECLVATTKEYPFYIITMSET